MATKTENTCQLSKEIRRLLAENSNLTYDPDRCRIKCSWSGHEMPAQVDAVRTYLGGKKFKKLQAENQYDYDTYQPHLVPSTKKFHEHQLFCTLTLRHINKTPEHVEKLVNGGKYKRALARWEECQKNGTVFKPNRPRREKEEGMKKGRDEDVEEDEESDTDSLSDLYPAMDFKLGDEDEGSDYDMNSMEVEDSSCKQVNESSSKQKTDITQEKRKAEIHVIKQKKKKHTNKKQRVG